MRPFASVILPTTRARAACDKKGEPSARNRSENQGENAGNSASLYRAKRFD